MYTNGLREEVVSQTEETAHLRRCAYRNTRSALVFVVLSAIGAFLGWRAIGEPLPQSDSAGVLGNAAVIITLVLLFIEFKCTRERLVIGLVTSRFIVGLVAKLTPAAFEPFVLIFRNASFALWVAVLGISLSMLMTSLRPPIARKS